MFIGSYDGKYRININKFLNISDFEYDDGYGSSEIATDLIIYFNDKSYITRGEYDGSEWWQHNKVLNYNKDDDSIEFDNLGGNNIMWKKVEDLNKVEN